jgi:hypothetical protein
MPIGGRSRAPGAAFLAFDSTGSASYGDARKEVGLIDYSEVTHRRVTKTQEGRPVVETFYRDGAVTERFFRTRAEAERFAEEA